MNGPISMIQNAICEEFLSSEAKVQVIMSNKGHLQSLQGSLNIEHLPNLSAAIFGSKK